MTQINKIWQPVRRFLPNKRYRTVSAIFFVGFILFGLVSWLSPTHGIGISFTDIGNGVIFGVTQIFLAFARVAIALTTFGLRMFLELAAYNDYITAPPVVLGWFMVRDVANMFFVVALLVIAFGTILGIEQYEWRKALAKLVLAAILINFSRLICGLIIDAAHVFTITFLNAITGAAGGNLINMFKLDQILSMSGRIAGDNKEDLRLDILVGSMMAMFFAIMAMVTVAAYMLVMVARVVVLWVAIILSPLAFVLQTIPQTKSWADDWWKEFGHHVMAAPVMVFFLWLAFATLGAGDINNHVGIKSIRTDQETQTLQVLSVSAQPSASLSAVSSWENMSAFIIAMGFLMVGLQQVQKLSVQGGGAVSGAINFGKRVATIASGYAAGRYLVGRAGDAATKAGVGLAKVPFKPISYAGKGIKKIAGRKLEKQWHGLRAWAADTGYKPKTKLVAYRDKDGKVKYKRDFEYDSQGNIKLEEHKRGLLQRFAHGVYQYNIQEQKKLDKTKNFADNRVKILAKRTTGVPDSIFQGPEESVDAYDRVEQGILAQEDARSKAKTEHFQAVGGEAVLASPRFKDGELKEGRKTLAAQIAEHQEFAKLGKANLNLTIEQGRQQLYGGATGEERARLAVDIPERLDEIEATDLTALSAEEAEALVKEKADLINERNDIENRIGGDWGVEDPSRRPLNAEQLLRQINLSEAGVEAAQAFVDNIRGEDMKELFKDAKVEIEALIKDSRDNPDELLRLSKERAIAATTGGNLNDAYLAKLVNNQLKSVTDIESKINEGQAKDSAANAVTHIQQGSAIQSSAFADVSEEIEKRFSGMERREAMAVAADMLTELIDKKQNLGPDEELSEYDQAALKGVMNKIDSESWNDDVMDQIFARVRALDPKSGVKLTDAQRKKAMKMKKIFSDASGLNWEKRAKDGYGRGISADLQQLMSVGGNIKVVRAHNAISDFHKNGGKIDLGDGDGPQGYEDLVKKVGYFGVARELQKKNMLNGVTAAELEEGLTSGASQDLLQHSTQDYVKNGKANKHYESIYNTNFDDREGIHRPMTEVEALQETVAEIVKDDPGNLRRAQVHSFGEAYDTDTSLLARVDDRIVRAAFAGMTEEYEAKQIPPRTALALSGYHKTEKVEQVVETDSDGKVTKVYMQFGGEALKKRLDDKGLSKHEQEIETMAGLILPQLTAAAGGFALLQKRNGQHIDLKQAAKGELNIALTTGLKFDNISEIQQYVNDNRDEIEKFVTESGSDFAQFEKDLTAAVAQAAAGKLVNTKGQTPQAER